MKKKIQINKQNKTKQITTTGREDKLAGETATGLRGLFARWRDNKVVLALVLVGLLVSFYLTRHLVGVAGAE